MNDADVLSVALAQESIRRVRAEAEIESMKAEIEQLRKLARVSVLNKEVEEGADHLATM